MLAVKLVKHDPSENGVPVSTRNFTIREAKAVHVIYKDETTTRIQLGDAPGETQEFDIGPFEACAYSVAYVMNEFGKTIERID